MPNDETVLLGLSQKLLDSIDQQDWETYTDICDPGLTAFEPEAVGNLVFGMDFHKFYFEMHSSGRARQSTISAPEVRVFGDCAIVTYIRLIQRINPEGRATTTACEETRVWQRQNDKWQHVHFHRSAAGNMTL